MHCTKFELSFDVVSVCRIRFLFHMSRLMGKTTICLGENKGADQLRSNCEADQRLCFRYSDSTVPFLLKSEISSFLLFCDCTGRFVSDPFGNHIVGFPRRRLICVHRKPVLCLLGQKRNLCLIDLKAYIFAFGSAHSKFGACMKQNL